MHAQPTLTCALTICGQINNQSLVMNCVQNYQVSSVVIDTA